MKKIVLFLWVALPIFIFGQNFNQHFEEKTLRLDFIFSGDVSTQLVALDELASYPNWWGKRTHLDTNLLRGAGQIRLYSLTDNQLIYTSSFSTLFQEWLSTEEANIVAKSFENVFLVPFPKQKVKAELVLFNDVGELMADWSATIDPSDILIHKKGEKNKTKYRYIHKAKDMTNAINVAIVAEGYTKKEMKKFIKKAKLTVEYLFSYPAFGKYADYFNFIAVESISEHSGVSVPHNGIWKNTAFGSNFDTFYSERYLTTSKVKQMHNNLAGLPYEHIIILANTDVYGGGGIYNYYSLTAANSPYFEPVVVHEFGHSFAGLADEYFYEGDALSNLISSHGEPWEKNITSLVDFESKWKHLLEEGTPVPTPIEDYKKYPVGVYQGTKGREIYTGYIDCRMKTNGAPEFCLVCEDAIEQLIRFLIVE